MNFTYEEALKEMDFLVEKMQLALPKESYRIQCAWEAIKTADKTAQEEALDDAWNDGYEMGKHEGYDYGYEEGYSEGYDEGLQDNQGGEE